MSSITHTMARFALGLQYEDIPADAVHEAKRFLLDSVGCALAAVPNEDMQAAHRYIVALGGTPEATVIGSGHRTNIANGALMNALLIRALDYNDIYWEQDPSHPSDVIPAALAAGEVAHRDGREIIVGMLIAYELEMRWCLAATPGVREVGWHHATLTQFVSPFVAARMLGLSEDQTVAAAGISGSSHFTLGGVVAGHLTNMKNTADPMATEAGVRAALLAREGYTGPVEVIEGKEGLIEVLSNVAWSTDTLLDGLPVVSPSAPLRAGEVEPPVVSEVEPGKKFLITTCSYKAFPTEALTHQPITAVLNICRANSITAEDVAEVHVRTTTRGADILSDPSKYQPTTKETADHSLPYCIAAAVADGNVLLSSFEEEKLRDPRIWATLPKIKVVADSEIDTLFPAVKRAIVRITTTDGEVYEEQVDHAKGSPDNPMSDDDIVAKFRANAAAVLTPEKQRRVIEATWGLEEFADVGDYMQLLVADK